MKRLLVLLVLVLTACGTVPPPGDYYVAPANGTFEPDHTYCSGNECWRVQFVDEIFAPTQEVFPTEVVMPTGVPTPSECWITPSGNVNINVRKTANTTAEILGTFNSGSQNKVWEKVGDWYKVFWFPTGEFGWTYAPLYSVTGTCSF